MDEARNGVGVAEAGAGGKIYAIGGYSDKYLNTVEVYGPVQNMWTKETSMPTARAYFSVVAFNGQIFVFGGDGSVNASKKVSRYMTLLQILGQREMPCLAIGHGQALLNTTVKFI